MQKFQNILILAGGDGTRFWPLEKKTYYPFLNRPLITYLVEKVKEYSEKTIIVVNRDYASILEELHLDNVDIIIQDSEIPGMGGAIDSCKNVIKGSTLILNAEDIFDYTVLSKYFSLIETQSPQIIFLAKKIDKYFPGGYFRFENDQIVEIIEKPDPDKIPSRMTKLVADYFSDFSLLTDVLSKVKTDSDDYYEKALSMLLLQEIKVLHVDYEGYWHTLKYPWDVLPMMNFFLREIKSDLIHKNVTISKNAVIIPPVYISANVKIGDFAKVVGPAIIGENTVIGDYALVRQSHIGKNCLIGGYSEVTRSYLDDSVMLHRNYVGDSVLSSGVLMGSGAVTANFRFDQKNISSKVKDVSVDTNLAKMGAIIGQSSKIGVNSTLLPGIKVGKHVFVAPGELVDTDVEDQLFLSKGNKKKNLQISTLQ